MSRCTIRINGEAIPYERSHSFLGIVIDRTLSWSPRIYDTRKRLISIAPVLSFLEGKSWGASVRSMLQRYRSLFLGCLRYSLPIFSAIRNTNIQTLQGVQAEALRICFGLPKCAEFISQEPPHDWIVFTDSKAALQALQASLRPWNMGESCNLRLKALDPGLRLRLPRNLARCEAILLCRLWIGVAFTNHYDFRMGMANSPACESCACEETIAHLLC
ncbi:uncharacterized protein LOC144128778 [Amblyomma americanum]